MESQAMGMMFDKCKMINTTREKREKELCTKKTRDKDSLKDIY